MSEPSLPSRCPKCGGPMETGFLATQQLGGGGLFRALKCSKIIWSPDFAMGFLGTPKGEDVSAASVEKKYKAIPSARCPTCRLILFEY